MSRHLTAVIVFLFLFGATSALAEQRLDRALIASADRVARLSPWPILRMTEMVQVALQARQLGDVKRARALVDDALADLVLVPVKRGEGGGTFHDDRVFEIIRIAALADNCARVDDWIKQGLGSPNVYRSTLRERLRDLCKDKDTASSSTRKKKPVPIADLGAVADKKELTIVQRAKALRERARLAGDAHATDAELDLLAAYEVAAQRLVAAERERYHKHMDGLRNQTFGDDGKDF